MKSKKVRTLSLYVKSMQASSKVVRFLQSAKLFKDAGENESFLESN